MAKTRYTTDFIPFTGIPKKRNIATAEQTAELESYFSHTPLPTVEQRQEIASNLDMKTRTVQIWFQNRRAKERKANKKVVDKSDGEDSKCTPMCLDHKPSFPQLRRSLPDAMQPPRRKSIQLPGTSAPHKKNSIPNEHRRSSAPFNYCPPSDKKIFERFAIKPDDNGYHLPEILRLPPIGNSIKRGVFGNR